MNKSIQSDDGNKSYSVSNSFHIPGQISSFNILDTLNTLQRSSSSSSDSKTLKHESNEITKGQFSSASNQSSKSSKNFNSTPVPFSDSVKNSTNELNSENGSDPSFLQNRLTDTREFKNVSKTDSTSTFSNRDFEDEVTLRKKSKGSTAIKRRSGNRRYTFSICMHF